MPVSGSYSGPVGSYLGMDVSVAFGQLTNLGP
jgi:hypothetical protein